MIGGVQVRIDEQDGLVGSVVKRVGSWWHIDIGGSENFLFVSLKQTILSDGVVLKRQKGKIHVLDGASQVMPVNFPPLLRCPNRSTNFRDSLRHTLAMMLAPRMLLPKLSVVLNNWNCFVDCCKLKTRGVMSVDGKSSSSLLHKPWITGKLPLRNTEDKVHTHVCFVISVP